MNMVLRVEDSMKAIRAYAGRVMMRLSNAGSVATYDDVVSECMVAWCIARDSWKEENGVPFMAYLRLGMRNHVNRWVEKELKEHNGSHLEFDRSGDEDGDSTLHDIFADENAELPEDAVIAADRRARQLARLSPRARQFVEFLDSPPKALVDILNGLRARKEFATERGVAAGVVPKRIPAALIFRFMGANSREQTRINEELEAKFNLKNTFAQMDRIKR